MAFWFLVHAALADSGTTADTGGSATADTGGAVASTADTGTPATGGSADTGTAPVDTGEVVTLTAAALAGEPGGVRCATGPRSSAPVWPLALMLVWRRR